MIEVLTDFPDEVAAFVCHGHVTKDDYETVVIPDIEKRLLNHDKVRIYYEIGSDFGGTTLAPCGRTPSWDSATSSGGSGLPWSPTSNGSSRQ